MSQAARAACIIVALLAVAFFMLQGLVDRLVYYPMRYPQGDWDAQGKVGAQDVLLKAKDGTRLNAWWFPKADARFATLFLHGNAGNVTHRVDHAQAIRLAGSSILVIDYRGYGKSYGRPCEPGLYLDADAAYEALIRLRYPPDRIILQGESLGTAVAVELASRRACAGLILESPLASLSRMAGMVLPVIGPLIAQSRSVEKSCRPNGITGTGL